MKPTLMLLVSWHKGLLGGGTNGLEPLALVHTVPNPDIAKTVVFN